MASIIKIDGLTKTYASGTFALDNVTLDIEDGEIIALLGPNGAGKTTLIGSVCGLVRITDGTVTVGGHDVVREPRKARRMIGLVPQEITLDIWETVWDSVRFSRGLFGLARDDDHIERVLKSLSLWDKRDAKNSELSGGMRRRVMIAKALSHEPKVLFLDEPTAGVDVNLRRDMWDVVRELRASGVTVILTTHYIEEAEEMADRIAVISKGRILLVDKKDHLMKRFGKKQLTLELADPIHAIPESLRDYDLDLTPGGLTVTYSYDHRSERTGITRLVSDMRDAGIHVRDLESHTSSLEEVFLDLVADTQEDAL